MNVAVWDPKPKTSMLPPMRMVFDSPATPEGDIDIVATSVKELPAEFANPDVITARGVEWERILAERDVVATSGIISSAPKPMPVLEPPLQLWRSAWTPMAVLSLPSKLYPSAPSPVAVLLLPVLLPNSACEPCHWTVWFSILMAALVVCTAAAVCAQTPN
jgi:hypothetical protein